MKKWWDKFYKNNKAIVWALVIAVVLSLGILWKVPDEVTRFTLIMPIFAGFILFSILVTEDEELGDTPENEEAEEKNLPAGRQGKSKKTSRASKK